MRSTLRRLAGTTFLGLAGLLVGTPAAAQGFGVGVRMAWIRSDVDRDEVIDEDSVRFIGGQIRLDSPQRMGVEVSLDRHSESFELLNQKVKETPIQASLLLELAGGGFQPYLLGGPGWYRRKVEPIEGPADELTSARPSSAGMRAGASRSALGDISASTPTIAIPSSTSTTMTMRKSAAGGS